MGPEGGLSQAHEPLTGGASRGSSSGPSPDIIYSDRPRPGRRRHAGQPYHQALGQHRGDRPALDHGGATFNRDVVDGHAPSQAEEYAARAGQEGNTNTDSDPNPIADHLANAAAYLPDPDTNSNTGADTNSIADHLANATAYLPKPDTNPRANPDTNAGAHSDANAGAHSDAHTGADAYPHACTRERAFNSSAELLLGTDPLDGAG